MRLPEPRHRACCRNCADIKIRGGSSISSVGGKVWPGGRNPTRKPAKKPVKAPAKKPVKTPGTAAWCQDVQPPGSSFTCAQQKVRCLGLDCQVIGEPIKQPAKSIGEPIKMTGKPALRITLGAFDWTACPGHT